MDMKEFNAQIIEEFRANGGRVAMFADYPMVILHTIGARSGDTHLIPLVLTITDDEQRLLFGSFAGSKTHPAWVHNLRAHGEIDVELASGVMAARVVELEPEEAARRVEIQSGISEQFAEYVTSAAPRQIPVFRIDER